MTEPLPKSISVILKFMTHNMNYAAQTLRDVLSVFAGLVVCQQPCGYPCFDGETCHTNS